MDTRLIAALLSWWLALMLALWAYLNERQKRQETWRWCRFWRQAYTEKVIEMIALQMQLEGWSVPTPGIAEPPSGSSPASPASTSAP